MSDFYRWYNQLQFKHYLPPDRGYLAFLDFFYPAFSEKDECCRGPFPLFIGLLKDKKLKADYTEVSNDTVLNCPSTFKQQLINFTKNSALNKLYIQFSFKTTDTLTHTSMICLEKNGTNKKEVRVFFKNSFGSQLMGDLVKSFPEIVKIFKGIFSKVEIISDKTQQQPLSSFSCAIITYFNMVDHVLNRPYRIPTLDTKRDSAKILEYRSLIAKDYRRYFKHYQQAIKISKEKTAKKHPVLWLKRKKLINTYKSKHKKFLTAIEGRKKPSAIPPIQFPKVSNFKPLLDFQVSIFLKEIERFQWNSLVSEQKYQPAPKTPQAIKQHLKTIGGLVGFGLIALSVLGLCGWYVPIFYGLFALSMIHFRAKSPLPLLALKHSSKAIRNNNAGNIRQSPILFVNQFKNFAQPIKALQAHTQSDIRRGKYALAG